MSIDVDTMVTRVDLADAGDQLESVIQETCNNKAIGGYRLAGCFEHSNQLVLIFQKTPQ